MRAASAATVLGSAACCFVVGQLLLALSMETWRPEWRDPELGARLRQLRRLTQEKGPPAWLVLGSSRVQRAFAPEVLAADQEAWGYNFGLTAAGPVREYLALRRLLADGIRPGRLLVEVLPARLRQEPGAAEIDTLAGARLCRSDLRDLEALLGTSPPHLRRAWLEARLLPAWSARFSLMNWFAPAWLPWGIRQEGWYEIDLGWMPFYDPPGPGLSQQHQLEQTRAEYLPALRAFRITADADRALRAVLELGQSAGTAPALLLMPESAEFRSWYRAESLREIDAYLTDLEREFGVEVIDCREWMADSDFTDGHHLTRAGARRFGERFAREVLPRLLSGRTAAAQ
ncbi:MAG: hypothetical protein NZ700_16620 [Gemmataceae bacterium]|nr:hypothetical protein [Gemmataceae bacterium]MDW8266044.1 hypothetical protein [Gemmataceae bacterium]